MNITPDSDVEGYCIDVKRFYLPFTIETKCPGCGTTITRALQQDYLSFPKLFTPTKIHFTHEVEEPSYKLCAEWSENVILSITLIAASEVES